MKHSTLVACALRDRRQAERQTLDFKEQAENLLIVNHQLEAENARLRRLLSVGKDSAVKHYCYHLYAVPPECVGAGPHQTDIYRPVILRSQEWLTGEPGSLPTALTLDDVDEAIEVFLGGKTLYLRVERNQESEPEEGSALAAHEPYGHPSANGHASPKEVAEYVFG